MKKDISIEYLWAKSNFKPNDNQRDAILHIEGPLFLTAGPGSGKTRVLLWRTLNLIVFHHVKPEEIFLSTFTEKAALQLKDGLRSLLGMVTNETGLPYDISKMAVGTVHSNCRRILSDRRFSEGHARPKMPVILDELKQYFKIHNHSYWLNLCARADFQDAEQANSEINRYFGGRSKESKSRHWAVINIISLFNRFSEECLNPDEVTTKNDVLSKILIMYKFYLEELNSQNVKQVDLSLLQKIAFEQLGSCSSSGSIFKHIIIDEYQDTNAIQESIFFALAQGHKNICVVGDDDQSLYRFRGATVENLVEFEDRCQKALGLTPKRIDLDINYRSRKKIVDSYTKFISIPDWSREPPLNGYYRVNDKAIKASSTDDKDSVVVSTHAVKETVYKEIAKFIYHLKLNGKIEDYSQCAFLFPAMKNNTRVQGYMNAFESVNKEHGLIGTQNEIRIYAPRAGHFLEIEETKAIWGLMLLIFGRPSYGDTKASYLISFRNWMFNCIDYATKLCADDSMLNEFVEDKKKEIENISKDYNLLIGYATKNNINIKDKFKNEMIYDFIKIEGLSKRAINNLNNKFFKDITKKREKVGKPFSIEYVINRISSLDWTVLDLFYQLNGFKYFRQMYDLAQRGIDEGPICNLGLITQYLSRFMDEFTSIITAAYLSEDKFIHSLFSSYTYALYRLEESEFEDKEVPFPKGRISFLTIHQSKGLEFPMVVIGSIDKGEYPNIIEETIRDLLGKGGEPLNRISKFDNMRMFYVALSRAQNLLVLPRISKTRDPKTIPRPDQMYAIGEFKSLLISNDFIEIPDFNLDSLQDCKIKTDELGKSYSYTGDYLSYIQCPRQYMIYRKYGFVASRSQTMMFGSLIHQTIEDLHTLLIDQRKKEKKDESR
jgi:DNA helicase II / ATP-dependent DNA helicase PcrA